MPRKPSPKNKYRSRPTEVDGITFASRKESQVYVVLRARERAGQISVLLLQVPFDLKVHGLKVCRYVADFTYEEDGKFVVADAKGFRTPVYKLKKKLMLACLGIDILEL